MINLLSLSFKFTLPCRVCDTVVRACAHFSMDRLQNVKLRQQRALEGLNKTTVVGRHLCPGLCLHYGHHYHYFIIIESPEVLNDSSGVLKTSLSNRQLSEWLWFAHSSAHGRLFLSSSIMPMAFNSGGQLP